MLLSNWFPTNRLFRLKRIPELACQETASPARLSGRWLNGGDFDCTYGDVIAKGTKTWYAFVYPDSDYCPAPTDYAMLGLRVDSVGSGNNPRARELWCAVIHAPDPAARGPLVNAASLQHDLVGSVLTGG